MWVFHITLVIVIIGFIVSSIKLIVALENRTFASKLVLWNINFCQTETVNGYKESMALNKLLCNIKIWKFSTSSESLKSVDCRLNFFADVTSRTFKCYKATTKVCGKMLKTLPNLACIRKYFPLTCATSVQENLRHVQNRKCINEREIFDKCRISTSLWTHTEIVGWKSINLIKNSFQIFAVNFSNGSSLFRWLAGYF